MLDVHLGVQLDVMLYLLDIKVGVQVDVVSPVVVLTGRQLQQFQNPEIGAWIRLSQLCIMQKETIAQEKHLKASWPRDVFDISEIRHHVCPG